MIIFKHSIQILNVLYYYLQAHWNIEAQHGASTIATSYKYL
jgi:hypothetical protein